MKDSRETEFPVKSTNNSPNSQGETLQYYSGLRGCGKDIFDYIHNKRNLPFIKIRNSTIAKSVGCTIRTVQRWTSEFARMGLITKHREDIFDTNQYQDNVPQPISFMMWFNSLTEHEQDMYMTHGIVTKKKKTVTLQIETVTPIYNPFPTPIYLQTNPNPIARDARVRYARARTIQTAMGFGKALDGDGFGFLSEKERNRKERVLKGIEMLKQEQKDWVLANGQDPRVKEWILGPKIKPLLITPTIEALTALLQLDEREQLKLVAYPDEALESIHFQVKGIVDGTTKSGPIKDRMGWFVWLAKDYCTKHNLTIDWRWYFEIAKILGIEAVQQGEPPKPLIVNQSQLAQKREGKSHSVSRNQTEEQKRYHDPEASLAYSKALGEEIDSRKLAKAIEEGDQATIKRLAPKNQPITKTGTPETYHNSVMLNRLAPDSFKQDWLDNPHLVPEHMREPINQVLEEFKKGIVISGPDTILTELSNKLKAKDQLIRAGNVVKSKQNPFADVSFSGQERLDEPPMIDYGMFEEIFETSEVVI